LLYIMVKQGVPGQASRPQDAIVFLLPVTV
jgi:hypothetical protein